MHVLSDSDMVWFVAFICKLESCFSLLENEGIGLWCCCHIVFEWRFTWDEWIGWKRLGPWSQGRTNGLAGNI